MGGRDVTIKTFLDFSFFFFSLAESVSKSELKIILCFP